MLEILNCVLLLILAFVAADLSMEKPRFAEAAPSWWGILFSGTGVEGFWRALFLNVVFAALSLIFTLPSHVREGGWVMVTVVFPAVLLFVMAYRSQVLLTGETRLEILPYRRTVIRRVGIYVFLLYLWATVDAVAGVLLKKP